MLDVCPYQIWAMKVYPQLPPGGGGGRGDTRLIVLYTCMTTDQTNVKKGLVFEAKRDSWGQNQAKFSLRGCFSWRLEIVFRVCFENLWSHKCTTLAFECPPPQASRTTCLYCT